MTPEELRKQFGASIYPQLLTDAEVEGFKTMYEKNNSVKTAEEILEKQLEPEDPYWNVNHIRAMKEYGKQCAYEALKDAVSALNEELKDFEGLRPELSDIILSTPIQTP